MVTEERFDLFMKYKNDIDKLDGDIVECGVWRGGMSIFLAKCFNDKQIWVCDSFEGCQDPQKGKYEYLAETHTQGLYAINIQEVKTNFINYGFVVNDPRIKFLKGFVKDTLDPSICEISKISILRIDVDAYSATMEVLDALYDKVEPGGYIIFDDSCLSTCHSAMKIFFERIGKSTVIEPNTYTTLSVYSNTLPCGCFIQKEGNSI
jgi:hypothetical protein